MNDAIFYERKGAIGSIVLNRPEQGNAIDRDATLALVDSIDQALGDPDARVIVVRSSSNTFCVGGSIRYFAELGSSLADALDDVLTILYPAMHRLAMSDVPVVSSVCGAIGGGGIGLALCADFVIAADSMRLGGGYAAIGLTPDAGTSWFLTRRIGAMRAKQILMTNVTVPAKQCFEWGLVNEVVPDAELAARTDAFAQQLSQMSPLSLARIKQLVDGAFDCSLQSQLDLEHRYMVEAAGSRDAAAGIAAFIVRARTRRA
ncbi:enoyl-CoA hydratase/isomerase family protein [Burkholderia lata]|uniref:Enoyl-CoA hydratase n=1 Tax=Burkholderia lata (strain ATCC 17760 / DSM 23089 / LMG 22485 / NCIMB 9086 / R18194 / 383) TaxID=482957 RepID=A0A6P2I6J0_BURL3|nr:enoyl-CoA hydratase/isomerase family protein [Burkholderia lata]VWB25370.1 enoyl-CoA hydratase [Burkholderia lata]